MRGFCILKYEELDYLAVTGDFKITPSLTFSSGLINLLPDETDELLQRIDQPLTEETDVDTVRYFSHRNSPCYANINYAKSFSFVCRVVDTSYATTTEMAIHTDRRGLTSINLL